ncbi:MAG TPA: hypothetical protein VEK37_04105, partial [Gemmatimonadaceae bacterium]|nr:hypothetical protein [Gemmatimonadaceae bacterium]
MRQVLPWITVYLLILLVWALIILRRSGPTLWKGSSLVALNIAFVLVSTTVVLLQGGTLGSGLIVFDVVLIIIALVMRQKWLLLGISHADSAAVLERCFIQTRATALRRADAYAIQCGGAEMLVLIRPATDRMMSVRFSGGGAS